MIYLTDDDVRNYARKLRIFWGVETMLGVAAVLVALLPLDERFQPNLYGYTTWVALFCSSCLYAGALISIFRTNPVTVVTQGRPGLWVALGGLFAAAACLNFLLMCGWKHPDPLPRFAVLFGVLWAAATMPTVLYSVTFPQDLELIALRQKGRVRI